MYEKIILYAFFFELWIFYISTQQHVYTYTARGILLLYCTQESKQKFEFKKSLKIEQGNNSQSIFIALSLFCKHQRKGSI